MSQSCSDLRSDYAVAKIRTYRHMNPSSSSFIQPLTYSSSDKEQLVEEEDDELKEVLDLRKIAVQLLQQEQQNRYVGLPSLSSLAWDFFRHWKSNSSQILCHLFARLLPSFPDHLVFSAFSLSLLYGFYCRRRSLICRAESLIHRRRVTGRAHRLE